jgi:hypothetical protein
MGVDWRLKKNTRGVDRLWQIKTAAGGNKALSGYTVTLKIWKGSTLLISSDCTVTSNTIGGVSYTILSGNFTTATRYNFDFEMVRGTIQEFTDTYTLEVTDSAPA